ncbi:hypothetical protein [Pseudorhodoferax sp. Leaf265]|uniref:hypothetical protein n=1 Tax=Pseudorhodoferax sp. Leaf265 TaxID=1736315 RepID=UPI0006F3F124|nr:hypothetical protein [Pseudorhodoferax sp. Leaf265]KQP21341.1 hypothetical protein ASF45_03960 [Pseudorhodoferax sp. Leaf265]
MTDQLRRCKTCGTFKPFTDYYKGPCGAFVRCKACCILARKAAYQKNPEYTKNLVRGYRAAAKARGLAATLGDALGP